MGPSSSRDSVSPTDRTLRASAYPSQRLPMPPHDELEKRFNRVLASNPFTRLELFSLYFRTLIYVTDRVVIFSEIFNSRNLLKILPKLCQNFRQYLASSLKYFLAPKEYMSRNCIYYALPYFHFDNILKLQFLPKVSSIFHMKVSRKFRPQRLNLSENLQPEKENLHSEKGCKF